MKEIKEKVAEIKDNMKNLLEEEQEEISNDVLKKRISRLTFLLASRINRSDIGNKENQIASIIILNQALMIADSDKSMSIKLFNVARRLSRART